MCEHIINKTIYLNKSEKGRNRVDKYEGNAENLREKKN
jgi:hypothetical protein